MIDEDRTMQLFGYTSSELKPKSHKRIVCICEECGKYRILENGAYRELCQRCSTKTAYFRDNIREHSFGNSHAWKGGGINTVCKNCGTEFKTRAHGLERTFCSNKCRVTYMVGENHSQYGTKASEETKRRISAKRQGISYDEWDGFTNKSRPHIVPINACIKVNDWFDGSHAHHITKSVIVYIPTGLHRHIKHNLKTGENMGEINTLAIQFINGGL